MHVSRVDVTDPTALRAARRAVVREVAAVRAALTRELPRVHLAAGRPVRVSPLLADLVGAALDAAARTGGDVDPTVGAALLRIRYAGSRPWLPACGSAVGVLERRVAGWREVRLDGAWLTVPARVLLDLRATASARTAERCKVLDPRTGHPVERAWASVTVVATRCVTASAFATAIAVRCDPTLPQDAVAHLS
jgi:FAD:protein FMN transferase